MRKRLLLDAFFFLLQGSRVEGADLSGVACIGSYSRMRVGPGCLPPTRHISRTTAVQLVSCRRGGRERPARSHCVFREREDTWMQSVKQRRAKHRVSYGLCSPPHPGHLRMGPLPEVVGD